MPPIASPGWAGQGETPSESSSAPAHAADSVVARALALAARDPWQFTIQYPPSREYFRERFAAPVPDLVLDARLRSEPRVLLYVHVPFCAAKCYYCNFAVDVRADVGLHRDYVARLEVQLTRLADALSPDVVVPGIDVGGGTPTILAPDLLERVLAAVRPWRARSDTPWPLSIETTPRIAATSPERLAVLVAAGVSRVSVGVQSTNDETLASVNRGEQSRLTDQGVTALLSAGFRRVNADLVFGLPGQTKAQWQEDLERVASFGLDSITTYDCLYRGQGRALTRRTEVLPAPAQYGLLYDLGYDVLTGHGYHARYGSVNFSRHDGETGTSPYFEGRLLDWLPYVGVGNYSTSWVGDHWWFAPHGVGAWSDAIDAGAILPADNGYRLPAREQMAKDVLLALSFGVLDGSRFARRFGTRLDVAFASALEAAVSAGWLREVDGDYLIVEGAFRWMPQIRALFYSEDAISWLEQRPNTGDRSTLQPLAVSS